MAKPSLPVGLFTACREWCTKKKHTSKISTVLRPIHYHFKKPIHKIEILQYSQRGFMHNNHQIVVCLFILLSFSGFIKEDFVSKEHLHVQGKLKLAQTWPCLDTVHIQATPDASLVESALQWTSGCLEATQKSNFMEEAPAAGLLPLCVSVLACEVRNAWKLSLLLLLINVCSSVFSPFEPCEPRLRFHPTIHQIIDRSIQLANNVLPPDFGRTEGLTTLDNMLCNVHVQLQKREVSI